MIIAITGTPGAGKTTIGRLLSRKLEYGFISLNELAREKNLYCGYDRQRKVNIVDIGKMEREILKIAEKKENIVIESHYAHDMPCDAIVVLRVQPKELLARGRKKGWPRAKIKENMEAEIMEVCKSEALESGKTVIEIDTTGKRPAEAAGEIVKRLNLRRA